MELDKETFGSLSKDTAKVISLLVLGVGSFIIGLIPACASRKNLISHPLILTGLLCFGAGVLLATSLVHMLPEVRHELPDKGFAEIIFCVGFLIVYLINELIHYSCGEAIQHIHAAPNNHTTYVAITAKNNVAQPKPNEIDCEHQRQHEKEDEEINARICRTNHIEPCPKKSTGHLGLLIALSVHGLLEGMAIGVQDTKAKVVILTTAVASHKFVVGFCLGVELAANSGFTFRNHFIAILLFALGSIIGIAAGMGIEGSTNTNINSRSIPILQGIAGGTLLYVTLCEVLPREKARWHLNTHNRGAGIFQLFSFSLGFALMTVLSVFMSDD